MRAHNLTFCQLDRASVKWLEQYLIAQKHVTCLIISHDSGYVPRLRLFVHTSEPSVRFLDTVTTDIVHYENKKVIAIVNALIRPTDGSDCCSLCTTRAICRLS